jgi:Uma2 family endonuclease
MATQPVPWFTPEEYLALERKAETKSEYVDGLLVAMSGATRAHILITVNLVRELSQQLRGRPCEVYAQDMRVRIAEGGMYAYPDVAAVCGEPEFEDNEFDVLLNPTLVVEVLSDSTEGYDRGLKSARYRRRASLQEYVLVAQDRVSVERYSRQGEQWVLTEATGLDDVMELPSIGCALSLRDVYDRVQGLSEADAAGV